MMIKWTLFNAEDKTTTPYKRDCDWNDTVNCGIYRDLFYCLPFLYENKKKEKRNPLFRRFSIHPFNLLDFIIMNGTVDKLSAQKKIVGFFLRIAQITHTKSGLTRRLGIYKNHWPFLIFMVSHLMSQKSLWSRWTLGQWPDRPHGQFLHGQ